SSDLAETFECRGMGVGRFGTEVGDGHGGLALSAWLAGAGRLDLGEQGREAAELHRQTHVSFDLEPSAEEQLGCLYFALEQGYVVLGAELERAVGGAVGLDDCGGVLERRQPGAASLAAQLELVGCANRRCCGGRSEEHTSE